MKTHVCVDARLINQSGIGILLHSILTSLNQQPIVLTLLCYLNDKETLKKYTNNLVTMNSEIYSFREQLEYAKKIPVCDLFWAPHFNVPLLPIQAKKRLTTVCDVFHLAHFNALTLPQKVYAKLFYNAAFALSDTVITISEFSKTEILKYAFMKPKRLEVVVPPFSFEPAAPVKKENFLLYVGNVKPHKNLIRLVRAYSILRPEEPLYIVGKKTGFRTADHELQREIAKDAFLRKKVHITDFINTERLKDLYAKASLFIFPSIYEGFGYPPLEAMASGCPVVAARIASIPEVCQDAVEYVDPFSVAAIADGIKRVLYNATRGEELIRKGKELVAKKKQEKNRLLEVVHACCYRS